MANGSKKIPGEKGEVTITIRGETFKELEYLLQNDGQAGRPDYTRSAGKAIEVYATFLRKKNEKNVSNNEKKR